MQKNLLVKLKDIFKNIGLSTSFSDLKNFCTSLRDLGLGYDIYLEEIKDRTAIMDLQKLTEGGWIKKIGDGPQTRYSKTSKKLPDIAG